MPDASTAVELATALGDCRDDNARREFLFGHPQILSPAFEEAVARGLTALPPSQRNTARKGIEFAGKTIAALMAGNETYPIGLGPLENLWRRTQTLEISMAQALKQAGEGGFNEMMTTIYGGALVDWAEQNAQEDRAGMLNLVRLVGAALHGGSPAGQASETLKRARTGYDFEWIRLATEYLIQVADGRVYHSALDAGERLLTYFHGPEWIEMRGKTLHRLGELHLLPYVCGRDPKNHRTDYTRWVLGFKEQHEEELHGLPEEQWVMPPHAAALPKAVVYFRDALSLLRERPRAECLKDMAIALEWEGVIGASSGSREEIGRLSREALSMAPRDEPQFMMSILSILLRSGEKISRETITELREQIVEVSDKVSHEALMEMLYQFLQLLCEIDPVCGLEEAVALRKTHAKDAPKMRQKFWETEAKLIRRIWRDWLEREKSTEPSLLAMANKLVRKEGLDRAPQRELAEGLFALAAAGIQYKQQTDAINLLEALVKLSPGFFSEYRDTITLERALLRYSAGAKAFHANDWPNGIKWYAEAVKIHFELGLDDEAMACWRSLYNLVGREGEEKGVLQESFSALENLSLQMQCRFGISGMNAVNDLCKRLLAMYHRRLKTEALFVLCQFAKGLQFGSALRSGSRYSWREDAGGCEMLNQMHALEAAISNEAPPVPEGVDAPPLLDDHGILGAYIGPAEQQPGATLREQLANLQRSYDSRLSQSLLMTAGNDDAPVFRLEKYCSSLDERTVLAYFYFGPYEGMTAVYCFLATREEASLHRVIYDMDANMRLSTSSGNRQAKLSMAGVSIGLLRKELLETPEGQRVSPEAAEFLAKGMDWYFDGGAALEQFKAKGKDHLCIVPDGALHFLPFHLLGKNQPLANQWIVTYLPHPILLFPDRARGEKAKHTLHEAPRNAAVIGLHYQEVNLYNLPELPQSRDETVEIAAVLGVQPVLEKEATEAEVLRALTEARWVHLSMHGQLNVAAPAFQCLYTAAGPGEDGRINAYELCAIDMSQLHLVTLSACETALGRFDAGDNLRGIPASLLLGGASCLVGTLWRVDADASKLFFTSLYAALNKGASRLEAYASAQRATRRDFPRYQDWGAFYLAGQWS